MEVEVKLRLRDAAAHGRLTTLLAPFHIRTHRQENLFFDGAAGELSSVRSILRIRFFNDDSRCVVSLKGRAVLADGVSRVAEDEEDLDPAVGRALAADPAKLGSVDSRVIKRARDEYGVVGDKVFVGLGGFRNVRGVYEWRGLTLEVDETRYDFGTCYEIECESDDPESAKKVLEEFMKENAIEYCYSEASKFAIFRSGKLPH